MSGLPNDDSPDIWCIQVDKPELIAELNRLQAKRNELKEKIEANSRAISLLFAESDKWRLEQRATDMRMRELSAELLGITPP
jgi:predicted nuclease with TOPRIM domain